MAESYQCAMWDNRLKMTKEHYEDLQSQIRVLIKGYSRDVVWEHRKTVRFAKDQFISFCWSLYWKIDYKRYNSAYTDTQTESALKRILSAYKEIR